MTTPPLDRDGARLLIVELETAHPGVITEAMSDLPGGPVVDANPDVFDGWDGRWDGGLEATRASVAPPAPRSAPPSALSERRGCNPFRRRGDGEPGIVRRAFASLREMVSEVLDGVAPAAMGGGRGLPTVDPDVAGAVGLKPGEFVPPTPPIR